MFIGQGQLGGDLFRNIGFEVAPNQNIVGYTEDRAINNFLSQPIEDGQSVVVLVGSQDNARELLKDRVTAERINEIASASELCGADPSPAE